MRSDLWRKAGLYLGLVDPYGDDDARRDRAHATRTTSDIVLFPLAAAVLTAAIVVGVLVLAGSSARSAFVSGVAIAGVSAAATILGGFVRRRQARRRLVDRLP
jgi:hypothetical protein